jgi:hypothetical protein
VDAPGYARLLDGYFESFVEKFPVRRPGQLNVAGMTLLSSLDSALRATTAAFLCNHPTVDAVLSGASPGETHWNANAFRNRDAMCCPDLCVRRTRRIGGAIPSFSTLLWLLRGTLVCGRWASARFGGYSTRKDRCGGHMGD